VGSNPTARADFLVQKLILIFLNLIFAFLIYNILMSKFGTYIQESYDELIHKVNWPSWNELQQTTLIVIVSLIVVTALIFGMDAGSEAAMKFVYSIASN
jgi:preprotein translocase subunit SecE